MATSLAAVALPDEDLVWTDEYAWLPVAQETAYTLAGALVIQEGTRLAGRPITLTCWCTRAQVDALRTLAGTADAPYTLTLPDARTFTVRFTGDRLRAVPVVGYTVHVAGDYYETTLSLMEV